MAESAEQFLIPLYYVNKEFRTTKTIFFRKGEDEKVTFEITAIIDRTKRFDHRIYRVHSILPTSKFPYLSRREALALRNLLKEELVKAMNPYPVAQFGPKMLEGMGEDIVDGVLLPVQGRRRDE